MKHSDRTNQSNENKSLMKSEDFVLMNKDLEKSHNIDIFQENLSGGS